MRSTVRHNHPVRRYEMQITQNSPAAAYYRLADGITVLIHPEVPFEYTGNGVGSRRAEAVFMSIRQSDRKAAVRCEFMAEYVIRHSKYHDIIVA